MQSIGIRELKQHTSRILRRVREEGEEILVTYRGRVVARMIPVSVSSSNPAGQAAIWSDLDQLSAEISARWPAGVTASQAVEEGRREL
jgi:prevent-host-death family protein